MAAPDERSNSMSMIGSGGPSPSPLTFSVITVCLNSEAHLAGAIESVLSQRYPHIEYIVVDGGSTDRTVAIVQSYGERIARFVSEPD
ncbi:MAG: glycosyltransferase, partial [Blastocatellia bacterium]